MSQSPRPAEELVLRKYQQAGLARVIEELDTKDLRSTLVDWATGSGKTVLMAAIAEHTVAQKGKRVLVLVNRSTLAKQARDKIAKFTTLRVGVEKAHLHAVRTKSFDPDWVLRYQPVVVASLQTLQNEERLRQFAPDEFALVIVDECHHILAPAWRSRLEYFTGAKWLGVTATPDRDDGKALGQVFQSVAHRYSIQDGIREKFLAPLRQSAVYTKSLDLTAVKRNKNGDFNEAQLARILEEEKQLQALAGPIFELSEDRPTITFAASVEHARLLADQINRRAHAVGNEWKRARWLDGESPESERQETIAAFERGEFQHLVGCMLFTEGFDVPRIACVAVARPTQSRALYTQMVGRGTRLSPETGKSDCLVLDFRGNAGKHSIVCLIDIFDGDMTPIEREEAEKISLEKPRLTMDDLVALAKQRVAERLAEERRLAARRDIIVAATYQVREVSPFSIFKVKRDGSAGGGPATAEQLTALGKLKIFFGEHRPTKIEAGKILTAARARARDGLADPPQMKELARAGIDGSEFTAERASRIIRGLRAGRDARSLLERQPGED